MRLLCGSLHLFGTLTACHIRPGKLGEHSVRFKEFRRPVNVRKLNKAGSHSFERETSKNEKKVVEKKPQFEEWISVRITLENEEEEGSDMSNSETSIYEEEGISQEDTMDIEEMEDRTEGRKMDPREEVCKSYVAWTKGLLKPSEFKDIVNTFIKKGRTKMFEYIDGGYAGLLSKMILEMPREDFK